MPLMCQLVPETFRGSRRARATLPAGVRATVRANNVKSPVKDRRSRTTLSMKKPPVSEPIKKELSTPGGTPLEPISVPRFSPLGNGFFDMAFLAFRQAVSIPLGELPLPPLEDPIGNRGHGSQGLFPSRRGLAAKGRGAFPNRLQGAQGGQCLILQSLPSLWVERLQVERRRGHFHDASPVSPAFPVVQVLVEGQQVLDGR